MEGQHPVGPSPRSPGAVAGPGTSPPSPANRGEPPAARQQVFVLRGRGRRRGHGPAAAAVRGSAGHAAPAVSGGGSVGRGWAGPRQAVGGPGGRRGLPPGRCPLSPESRRPRPGRSARVLLKRRELAELEQALRRQREELGRRMRRLARRRRQLRQRQERLRDGALAFDAFLKAVSAGRARAVRRAAGQEAEAARLRRELTGLRGARERLARRLRSLRGCRDRLQAVLASTDQFQDVPAVLAHLGALAGARAALVQEVEAKQEQLAQGWARLRRAREEVGSELLRASAERDQLHARLEAARRDLLQGECCWAQVQSRAAQQSLLLGQIKLAVLNLFQLATAWFQLPTAVALEDTEAQLDTVLLCMQDLSVLAAQLCPGQPGPCPPRLATSTMPLCRRGARGPPSQHQPPAPRLPPALGRGCRGQHRAAGRLAPLGTP
ncbi:cilia- and flagella-associated protein 73 [Colius striatus]|uniref:cilia- and flagella-associated protein 73 n=1 Tax=Colius striatus TaxID=57412 RepID=UPI002B1E6F44|nr:cilia- and flagella-associated protein 73 [Colius striatus]